MGSSTYYHDGTGKGIDEEMGRAEKTRKQILKEVFSVMATLPGLGKATHKRKKRRWLNMMQKNEKKLKQTGHGKTIKRIHGLLNDLQRETELSTGVCFV